MSVITMPSTLPIGAFSMGQARYDMSEVSDVTGSSSSRLFGPSRWRISISSMNDMTLAQGAEWESLVLRLRGKVNHLAVFDPVRRFPAGTMRGSPVLFSAAASGATAINIQTTASATLLVGDWLQLSTGVGTSALIKVVESATANGAGVMVVNFEPALRYSFIVGTPLTWDKPMAYYKSIGLVSDWSYQAGAILQSGFSLDLLEDWS